MQNKTSELRKRKIHQKADSGILQAENKKNKKQKKRNSRNSNTQKYSDNIQNAKQSAKIKRKPEDHKFPQAAKF